MHNPKPTEEETIMHANLRPGLTDANLSEIALRFRILGEPLRLRLLYRLFGGECSVTDLANQLGTTQPNVSKHLKVLLQAKLVQRRQQKNTAFYSVIDRSVFDLCASVVPGLAS